MGAGSLDDVLVVTVRKSFWRSAEAERFPHRIHARVLYGHSTALPNALLAFLRGVVAVWMRRPRLLVLGSVERAVPWFLRLKRLGLLARTKIVVTNQLHLDDAQLEAVERDIVYSQAWIDRQRPQLRRKAVFVPLPADGDFEAARRAAAAGGAEARVVTGGGAGRDFASVIAAVEGTSVPLEVITFSPAMLGWGGAVPANVTVSWTMPLPEFLARLAASLFVVVPLAAADSDHGQTTVVQALSLGKAIVATRSSGVVDYVRDGREGMLVDAGDVDGYRRAIRLLADDAELRAACERRAADRAPDLTYERFGARLAGICRELL